LERRLEGRVAHAVPAREALQGGPNGRGRQRPEGAVLGVADVDELARAIRGELLLPARHGSELRVVDPGEAAARVADAEAHALVRDDVRPRARRARVGDDILR